MTGTVDHRSYRLSSIDMVRGLAVVIMALDHVRDFFFSGALQDPLADPSISAGLFATRWITHFCAPVFILLAGTSAGLMKTRRTPAQLARFLLTRGLWLIFVEWVIVSTSWTFAPGGIAEIGGRVLVVMQVIWAIGASMIALSILQLLGRGVCLGLGVAILIGHNLLDSHWPASALFHEQPPWVVLHSQMAVGLGPFFLIFIYPLLPWIGVMLLGFGSAGVFELPQEERNAILLKAGISMSVAFLLVRGLDTYGDPNHWLLQPAGTAATVIDFLNTTKYPPSLIFLLMTLGPATILCALSDRIAGKVKNGLVMFGRVPFAFYILHLFLIHALSVLLGILQGFSANEIMTFYLYYPKGYGLGLPGVYGVWVLVVALMYPFCRWIASVKARRRDWWLSYL